MKGFLLLLILLNSCQMMQAQPRTSKRMEKIFSTNNHPVFRQVINDPAKYRLQVIYTEINRDKNNRPSFKHHYFHYDPALYFNPASIVKLPLAILSLEKLNEMGIEGVDRNTAIHFEANQPWQKALSADATSATGQPSIAHFIKRALLVSENDPYNRMYQFLGQGWIKKKLEEKGYSQTRITRQFLGLTTEHNRHTNAFRFLDPAGNKIYEEGPAYNKDSFVFTRQILLGRAHMRNNELIAAPFDFTAHNITTLADMQQMLQAVLFPESVPAEKRFNLKDDDRAFLKLYLSQYPSETSYPKYDPEKYYDSYVRFFFRDSSKKMPQHVRVFNKVGWSYGFLNDISYVVDFEHGIEFMLSATVYVNSNETLNDNKYEYETVGHPFLYQLGQTIYQYELNRKRKFRPDLSAFRLVYEKRDPEDRRPLVKEVDN